MSLTLISIRNGHFLWNLNYSTYFLISVHTAISVKRARPSLQRTVVHLSVERASRCAFLCFPRTWGQWASKAKSMPVLNAPNNLKLYQKSYLQSLNLSLLSYEWALMIPIVYILKLTSNSNCHKTILFIICLN